MKKMFIGIMLAVLGMSYAHADVNADLERQKAVCQASDKFLWVERNQVCIYRNPCDHQAFERYCNRDFKDYQSPAGSNMYIKLINLYAETHGLDCKAVAQDAAAVGQDYVVCMGTDVMVFEFDDINDHMWTYKRDTEEQMVHAICTAVGGTEETSSCQLSPKPVCNLSHNALANCGTACKYMLMDISGDTCKIKINIDARDADRDAIDSSIDYKNNIGLYTM